MCRVCKNNFMTSNEGQSSCSKCKYSMLGKRGFAPSHGSHNRRLEQRIFFPLGDWTLSHVNNFSPYSIIPANCHGCHRMISQSLNSILSMIRDGGAVGGRGDKKLSLALPPPFNLKTVPPSLMVYTIGSITESWQYSLGVFHAILIFIVDLFSISVTTSFIVLTVCVTLLIVVPLLVLLVQYLHTKNTCIPKRQKHFHRLYENGNLSVHQPDSNPKRQPKA